MSNEHQQTPPSESALVIHKWVRIMCEFTAEGVWAHGGGAVSLDDLPVGIELRRRIRTWQDWYERDAWGVEFCDEIPASFDICAFSEEGLAIAKAVKAELPDWTVIYYDEAKTLPLYQGHRATTPRSRYEYEV